MENNIDLTKKIEAYLDNELTEKERLAFEKQLNSDKDLKKELEIHQNIRESFKIQGEKDLKGQFENYYHKHKLKERKQKTLKILWPVIAVAASIILFFTLFNSSNTSPIDQDNFITLDTIQVNTMEEHADSASYELEKKEIDSEKK